MADELSDLPLDKPTSLLFYLAQRSDWVSRSELAFLYRPDVPESTALHSVRNLLHRARRQPWLDDLEVETSRLRFVIPTDVQIFRSSILNEDWRSALELYRGPFLDGIKLADVVGYEAWLELERQSLAGQWRLAAVSRAETLRGRGDYAEAALWLERALRSDPLDEGVLQSYLSVLQAYGQRTQALTVYAAFRRELEQELGILPLETTQALIGEIRLGEMRQSRSAGEHLQPPDISSFVRNLPAATTSFIGRKWELERLSNLLAEPDRRLVTVVGLGGSGKTRLALEALRQQPHVFRDGVIFVPLAGVTTVDQLVPSVARALGCSFSGPKDSGEQLTDFLRHKRVLLLLDNFEQLLAGATLLGEWLGAAAHLSILVTSRTALALQGETLFDIEGLSYPLGGSERAPETYDAMKLFLERAERVSSSLLLDASTLQAAASICRKVEGLPLALELAASWTRSLSVRDIDRQLDKNLELLSGTLRDLPARQQSVRAVFDYAWQQLSEPAQATLTRLSIFRGGFTLAAAEAIAETHLPLLLNLMNNALLRRSREGRYSLHELVRQYAAQKLDTQDLVTPKRKQTLQTTFSRYYLGLLVENEPYLRGREQLHALNTLLNDVDNLRAAYALALAQEDWGTLDSALDGLRAFFWEANLIEEGPAVFTQLVRALEASGLQHPQKRLLARALLRLGMFQRDSGLYPEAQTSLERAASALRALEIHEDLARALQLLSTVARQTGHFREAERYLEESLELSQTLDDTPQQAFTLYGLALLKRELGQYAATRELLEQCLRLREAMGDLKGVILVTSQLGTFAREVDGDLNQARRYTERALRLSRQLEDKKNEAIELTNLAIIALEQGREGEGERDLQASLKLKRQVGHRSGEIVTLTQLGALRARQGAFEAALGYLQEAWDIGVERGTPRSQFATLAELGEAARRQGDSAAASSHFTDMMRLASTADIPPRIILQGLYYLALFQQQQSLWDEAAVLTGFLGAQPGSLKGTRDEVQVLAAQLEPQLSAPEVQRLQAVGSASSLAQILVRQLSVLERGSPPA